MGMSEAARLLQTDAVKARQLARSGFLGPFEETTTGRIFVDASRVEAAAGLPSVEPPHPDALIVRLANKAPAEDPAWPARIFTGYGADLTPGELRDSARGWWRVRDPESWQDHLLIATMVGFVIGAWKITGYDNGYGGLRRFDLKQPGDHDGAERFLNRRLRTGSGGNTVHLAAQDWPTR